MQGHKRLWHSSSCLYPPAVFEETHRTSLSSMIRGVATRYHATRVKFAWCVHNTYLIRTRCFDSGRFGKTTTNGYAHVLKHQVQSSSSFIHRAEGKNTGDCPLTITEVFCLPREIDGRGHGPDTARTLTHVLLVRLNPNSHEPAMSSRAPFANRHRVMSCHRKSRAADRCRLSEDGTSFISDNMKIYLCGMI